MGIFNISLMFTSAAIQDGKNEILFNIQLEIVFRFIKHLLNITISLIFLCALRTRTEASVRQEEGGFFRGKQRQTCGTLKTANEKIYFLCSHFVLVSVWGNEFTALQMAYMSLICCFSQKPPFKTL